MQTLTEYDNSISAKLLAAEEISEELRTRARYLLSTGESAVMIEAANLIDYLIDVIRGTQPAEKVEAEK